MSDGPAIGFRPLGRDDFAQLARWFSEPQVDRWWNEDSSPGGIEAKYGRRVDGLDATSMWVIEIDGCPAGLAQHYRHDDYPDHDAAVGLPHAVGIDYLLGAAFAGQGLGPIVLAEPRGSCLPAPPELDAASRLRLRRTGRPG